MEMGPGASISTSLTPGCDVDDPGESGPDFRGSFGPGKVLERVARSGGQIATPGGAGAVNVSGELSGESPGALQYWRVFVVLRDRPGVYERSIRGSAAWEAEQSVTVADPDVLEILGSQPI